MKVMLAPIGGAIALGLVDEEVAIFTKASAATKGSYLPRLGFEAAAVASGIFLAPRMAQGPMRNALLGASVGGAALLGTFLVDVATGGIKL